MDSFGQGPHQYTWVHFFNFFRSEKIEEICLTKEVALVPAQGTQFLSILSTNKMSVNKLSVIPNGTEFYVIEPGHARMTGVFLHTAPKTAYFLCPGQGILQASAVNILHYYYYNFLKISPSDSDRYRDPLARFYVTKGSETSLQQLLLRSDEEIARIGMSWPERLDLLPRHCPCYIQIGTHDPWNGIAIHEAPRQARTSAFFSDNSLLFGANATEALEVYRLQRRLPDNNDNNDNPLEHIYLAEGPHKGTSLAYMFKHASDLALRDCLKPPLEPSPTIPETMRRSEATDLKALNRVGPVKVEVASVALFANLEDNGTFTYDDGEVGFSALNSFELLWHLRKKGLPSDAAHRVWGLESRLALDPSYALRSIFFRPYETTSLAELVDDMFKDMPALIPVPPSYEVVLERLEAKEAALLDELRILEDIMERQARIKALEQRRDELKALITE